MTTVNQECPDSDAAAAAAAAAVWFQLKLQKLVLPTEDPPKQFSEMDCVVISLQLKSIHFS